MQLNQHTWPSWSKIIASPADPEEYSPAAVERLMVALDPYVVDVKGVHPQFKAHNSISVIDFRSDDSRRRYEMAYENFLQEKAKIEAKAEAGGFTGNAGLQILVQLLKFRMAAELEKIPDICDRMIDAVEHGEAAVASLNFKQSIAAAVRYMNDRGISRDKISLIWGGGNSSMNQKRKKKLELKKKMESNKALMDLFEGADIDLYDLGLAGVEEVKEIVKEGEDALRLGAQDYKERQKEIDRFQSGKTLYCFFTIKAGGVGLSLHHTDELTSAYNTEASGFKEWEEKIKKVSINHRPAPGKVRRRESGNAVEEDILFIPTRPRRLFGATTYSAIELVQMLGRCPRLTSLSDTYQTILFYKGTIEERVAIIVSIKLRCLRKVVRQKESWEEVIMGGYRQDDKHDIAEKVIKAAENDKPEDTDELIDEESEEEDV